MDAYRLGSKFRVNETSLSEPYSVQLKAAMKQKRLVMLGKMYFSPELSSSIYSIEKARENSHCPRNHADQCLSYISSPLAYSNTLFLKLR